MISSEKTCQRSFDERTVIDGPKGRLSVYRSGREIWAVADNASIRDRLYLLLGAFGTALPDGVQLATEDGAREQFRLISGRAEHGALQVGSHVSTVRRIDVDAES